MATAIPEVHALGGDDVVVVACYPAAAGAGSTRQGADRALNCSKETEKLPTCSLQAIKALSHGLHQQIELVHSTSSDEDVRPFKTYHCLTVVGGVGAALPVGSSCRCGAVITAPVGGGSALYRILSGKRRSSLGKHDTTGKKKETFNRF